MRRQRLIDLVYLIVLGAFVFAIAPTFHGDEAMFISMSRDYVTAFIDHDPAALMTTPPYPTDSDQNMRLINGTVNRYAIGLSWQIAGLTANDLPPRPGWQWALDYDSNASGGFLPSSAMLAAARVPSTLFLALSVAVMFALGWQMGGRRLAYFVSGLYAINPIILLNGRRALQEGSLLFFGLLMILAAVMIVQQRGEGKATPRALWAALWGGLIVAGGLTLASKQNGIVFVAGALGWIFVAEVATWNWHRLWRTTLALIVATGLIAALFVVLSPALWNDPPARIVDLLQVRAELLASQVKSEPNAPTTLAQRIGGIVTQPFMTPPQHFEVAFWANFKPITDDITRYMSSPLSGLQFGVIVGGALTLLTAVGIVFSLRGGAKNGGWQIGVLVWLLVTVASLLVNPLPWQRYSLPLIPVVTLLAGVGLDGVLRWARRRMAGRFVWKPEQAQVLSHGESQNG